MKYLLLTAGVFAVTLTGAVAATPENAPAPAAQPAPFVVDSCRAEYAGGWLVKSISGLRIKFTNEGDKAASVGLVTSDDKPPPKPQPVTEAGAAGRAEASRVPALRPSRPRRHRTSGCLPSSGSAARSGLRV